MKFEENSAEAIPPEAEPGMNLISLDFEILMVNRTNERLYRKPAVALMGKKCYREFEKADEPCPHCPGRLAVATGEAHQTETVGVRDDGTRFAARIRAHPVTGPDNQPTGFIEIVEDITEEEWAESLATIHADLRAVLPHTQSAQKALRETLEAALRVEGIDMGCVFMVDQTTGEQSLVHQQGLTEPCLEALSAVARGEPMERFAGLEGMPRALEVIPILQRGDLVANVLVGASGYPEIPPTLLAGVQSLGTAAGHAISRIRAEQSRGDAVADLEALIAATPLPTWILDVDGRITKWNKAAERLFGWKAVDVVGEYSPVGGDLTALRAMDSPSEKPPATVLPGKDGTPVEVRLYTAPFRDVVGDFSTLVVMAEDLTLTRRLADVERRLAELETLPPRKPPKATGDLSGDASAVFSTSILIVDSNEPWGEELALLLSELGYVPTRCSSVSESAVILADAEAEGYPFILAIVDLVPPAGSSGLAQAAVLRGLGLEAPVIVTSDADVRGYERHGIAGVIKRPFDAMAVDLAVRSTLRDQG